MDLLKSKVKGKGKAKEKEKSPSPTKLPSSNWLALQKKISSSRNAESKTRTDNPPRKKRKLEDSVAIRSDGSASDAGSSRRRDRAHSVESDISTNLLRGLGRDSVLEVSKASASSSTGNRESVEELRKMVLGQLIYSDAQKEPGKYLAMDCEMVGVGLDGSESSLARVSLVNYNGAIVMDEFVRQRERVVDYRTAVSGIRETDMVNARPFSEVQKKVAELLKDRILVGHAVFNDLKALLLSHPRPLTRDTQLCAGKAKLLKTKYPALRKLVQQELGIAIQAGEHSSVTDARATMAVYRLHRKEWDKGFRSQPLALSSSKKRKALESKDDEHNSDEGDGPAVKKKGKTVEEFPGGGRKGVSSGLSTVVRRSSERTRKIPSHNIKETKSNWWATLNDAPSKGSKGSIRISSNR